MITTTEFFTAAQWMGIATIVFALLAGLGFILSWGIRFRLVGITGFMLVLTAGLFALSIVPYARTAVPGAVRYTVVYDSGAAQAVVTVPSQTTEEQLDATLRQAAIDLYSYGRLGGVDQTFTVRARTILHPREGVSQPLFLGQIKRSLAQRNDVNMVVELFHDNLAQLPPIPPVPTAPNA